jgi:hypothetical protein
MGTLPLDPLGSAFSLFELPPCRADLGPHRGRLRPEVPDVRIAVMMMMMMMSDIS